MTNHPTSRLPKLLLVMTAFTTLITIFPGCSHLGAPDAKDPDQALLLKSGDKEPVMDAGLNKAEWNTVAAKPSDQLDKGIGEVATNRLEEAENSVRSFLAKHPGNEKAFELLSSILFMRGSYEKAAYYAKILSSKNPSNTSAYNIEGLSLLKRSNGPEDIVEAERLFEKAFKGGGAEIAAGLNLGYLLLETGNSQKAFKIFEETAERCNKCLQSILGAGIASRRNKNFKASQEYLDAASKNKNTYALYHKAIWHIQSSNDLQSARETLVTLNSVVAPGSLAQKKGSALFQQIISILEDKEK